MKHAGLCSVLLFEGESGYAYCLYLGVYAEGAAFGGRSSPGHMVLVVVGCLVGWYEVWSLTVYDAWEGLKQAMLVVSQERQWVSVKSCGGCGGRIVMRWVRS